MLTASFEHARVSAADTKKYAKRLSSYRSRLRDVVESGRYGTLESSLVLPDDVTSHKQITRVVNRLRTSRLKYVIVVGIGGSNLGTKAIYDALFGYTAVLKPDVFPKLICLDTCDPVLLDATVNHLRRTITSPEEYVINVVSKSGGTTETAGDAAYLFKHAELAGLRSRTVVTTDHGSPLWEMATSKGYTTLEIPHMVGGRYSVFSAVGLFPLALLGINTKALLKGARWAREQSTSSELDTNIAAQSAIALASHYAKGISIHDSFFFFPALESVGKWYRQLLAESIGKVTRDGKDSVGITPTVSVGSTDLHSMAQLYLSNPQSRFTTFIGLKKCFHLDVIPSNEWSDLVGGLSGNSPEHILDTIYTAVRTTYARNGLPFAQIDIEDLSPMDLGAWMQTKMLEVMYLGHLLGVNAFDQPHVELYKKEVKKLLQ